MKRQQTMDLLKHHAVAVAKATVDYHGERKSISREYQFKVCRQFSPIAGVEKDGVRYYVSTADWGVGLPTFVHGHYEIDKLAVAERLIIEKTNFRVRGMGFLDIGANIGTTSIPAIKTFGSSHAWAFEPGPEVLKLLRCNVIVNDLEQDITVLPIAISDHNGSMDFQLSDGNWGDNRVVVNDEDGLYHEAEWPTVSVKVGRFDNVADDAGIDLKKVGLVWIDTQGHEGHVLSGAPNLIASGVPLLTEYCPYTLRRSSGLDLYHDLVAANFSTVIDIGGKTPVEYAAREVATIAEKYPNTKYTDLLLLR